jgi:hypothetical protein
MKDIDMLIWLPTLTIFSLYIYQTEVIAFNRATPGISVLKYFKFCTMPPFRKKNYLIIRGYRSDSMSIEESSLAICFYLLSLQVIDGLIGVLVHTSQTASDRRIKWGIFFVMSLWPETSKERAIPSL